MYCKQTSIKYRYNTLFHIDEFMNSSSRIVSCSKYWHVTKIKTATTTINMEGNNKNS